MIDRERVDPGFDIGEVLHKKLSHIRVDLIAIRDRQISTGATPRFLLFLASRGLGELPQGKTVSNVPSNAWQLASAISYACKKAGKWTIHASRPSSIAQYILGLCRALFRVFAPTQTKGEVCNRLTVLSASHNVQVLITAHGATFATSPWSLWPLSRGGAKQRLASRIKHKTITPSH